MSYFSNRQSIQFKVNLDITINIYIMKITKILMMLLLTSAIFVSCGSSPADDGKKVGELFCEAVEAGVNGDTEKQAELNKEAEKLQKELEEKYGGEDVSEEDQKAFADAMAAAMKECM